MQVKTEYQDVIKKVIQNSDLIKGNEDLLEEFCGEVYRRTYLVLSTKDDKNELEEYIAIISNKVIQDVLKNNLRPVKRQQETTEEDLVDYVIDKHKYMEEADNNVDERKEISKNPYRDYVFINDPLYSVNKKNLRRKMKKLVSAIYEIHMQMPEKLYFQIFYYKYCKGLEQVDVARKTGLSQNELSRRILNLAQILKAYNVLTD